MIAFRQVAAPSPKHYQMLVGSRDSRKLFRTKSTSTILGGAEGDPSCLTA